MKSNPLWMLLGCTLPLLLVPILSSAGVNRSLALGLAVALMIACHLFMPGHRHSPKRPDGSPDKPLPSTSPTNETKP